MPDLSLEHISVLVKGIIKNSANYPVPLKELSFKFRLTTGQNLNEVIYPEEVDSYLQERCGVRLLKNGHNIVIVRLEDGMSQMESALTKGKNIPPKGQSICPPAFKHFLGTFLNDLYKADTEITKKGLLLNKFIYFLNENNKLNGKREFYYEHCAKSYFEGIPEICKIVTRQGKDYIYPPTYREPSLQRPYLKSVGSDTDNPDQQLPLPSVNLPEKDLERNAKILVTVIEALVGNELTIESFLQELHTRAPECCENFKDEIVDDLEKIHFLLNLNLDSCELRFSNGKLRITPKVPKCEYCPTFPFTTAYKQDKLPFGEKIEIVVLCCEPRGSKMRVYFQLPTSDDFFDKMSDYVNSMDPRRKFLSREEVHRGLPCVVHDDDGKRLRRAVVTEVTDAEARVCLVDLQEFRKMSVHSLMRLDKRFWSHSVVAYEAEVDRKLSRNDRERLAENLIEAGEVSVCPIRHNETEQLYVISCEESLY